MTPIVMYHFVHGDRTQKFEGLHRRTQSELIYQIDFLNEKFGFLTKRDFLEGNFDRGALLTFDDGLLDHHEQVAPILLQRGIHAVFAVSSLPITSRCLLPVHKLQLLLGAYAGRTDLLLSGLEKIVGKSFWIDYLESNFKNTDPQRFDSPRIVAIKRLFQRDFPSTSWRDDILDKLVAQSVMGSWPKWSDLYMGKSHLKDLVDWGMTIANHTHTHPWLSSQDASQVRAEIGACDDFLLSGNFVSTHEPKALAYPYGDVPDEVDSVFKEFDMKFGFTTVPAFYENNQTSSLAFLPRFDTNDFPRGKNDHEL